MLLCVEWSSEALAALRKAAPSVEVVSVGSNICTLPEAWKLIKTVQYGDFLNSVQDLKEDDYVFFIDADITIQRSFYQHEVDALLADTNKVYATFNARGDNSLWTELQVLGYKGHPMTINQCFPNIRTLPCYNGGVLGMSPANWRKLRDQYKSHFKFWNTLVSHHASVQFFISYLLGSRSFKMHDASQWWVKDISSHCHEEDSIKFFNIARGLDGGIYRRDDRSGQIGWAPVMLAHAHLHTAWQHLLQPRTLT